jgi:hypothetical protein
LLPLDALLKSLVSARSGSRYGDQWSTMEPMNGRTVFLDSLPDDGDRITLAPLRARRDDILQIAAAHDALNIRVFGSVARGEVPWLCPDASSGSSVSSGRRAPAARAATIWLSGISITELGLRYAVGSPGQRDEGGRHSTQERWGPHQMG